MSVQTGDRCEECNAGRMHVYKSRTSEEFIVRYLRCRACGHRPEGNKLVIPLAMARKIIGKRYKKPSVVQTPAYITSARRTFGDNWFTMNEQLLITRTELCKRLGVSELDYISAEMQGRVPSEVILNIEAESEPRYSWPAVLVWLEAGCPIVDKNQWHEFVASEGDRIQKETLTNA